MKRLTVYINVVMFASIVGWLVMGFVVSAAPPVNESSNHAFDHPTTAQDSTTTEGSTTAQDLSGAQDFVLEDDQLALALKTTQVAFFQSDVPSSFDQTVATIQQVGLDRNDPYLQARGLVRSAWSDLIWSQNSGQNPPSKPGRWNEDAIDKFTRARQLTAAPPSSFKRRKDYLIARSEIILIHGYFKLKQWLPGYSTADQDLREGLRLSCQTEDSELICLAHLCSFESDFQHDRKLFGLFHVIQAEHLSDMCNRPMIAEAVRYAKIRSLVLMEVGMTDDARELLQDTIAKFPPQSRAYRIAKIKLATADEIKQQAKRYLESAKQGRLPPDFVDELSFQVLENRLDANDASLDLLRLANLTADHAAKDQNWPIEMFARLYQAKVMVQLGMIDEFFTLANKLYKQMMNRQFYLSAQRLAVIGIEVSSEERLSELNTWKDNLELATTMHQEAVIAEANNAAEMVILHGDVIRQARVQELAANVETEKLRQKKRKADVTFAQKQLELESSRTALVLWGAATLLSIVIGITAIFWVRSSARQKELEGEIQQRSRAEAQLKEAQKHQVRQQRLQVLGEMAAGVAHDVNNSLSSIAIYSELMSGEHKYTPKQLREFSRAIEKSATDVSELIHRLHPFYRKSIDKGTIVQVDQIVQQFAGEMQEKYKDQQIEVHCQSQEAEFVCVDSDIQEILTSLTNNSISAMPDGGVLTIRCLIESSTTDSHACKQDAVALEHDGQSDSGASNSHADRPHVPLKHLILEVEDNGCGMEESVVDQCLQPFFSTNQGSGRGLGLAATQAIVQSYNGTIDIESSLGKGTLFRIKLPCQGEQEDGAESTAFADVPTLKILLVEDDPATRESTKLLLETQGHIVETSISLDAVSRLKAEPFDMLLSDYKMPGLDGYSLCKRLSEQNVEIKKIIMSGFEEPGIREICDAYIAKPISSRRIAETLQSVYAKRANDPKI